MGKVELKLPPPLKSVAALPCENQVVNYTALQHISVQSEVKTFNYGKCSRRMLFLCFSTQINFRHVFKMSTLGIYASFEW